MKLFVLIVLLCALAWADASDIVCSNVTTEGIPQYFCKADLVFVGIYFGGSSGLVRGENNEVFKSTNTDFSVEDYFKGGDDSRDEISIHRVCYSISWCKTNPFPRSADSSLVFASSKKNVQEYIFSLPWECVSEELKDQIEQGSFHCGN